MGELEFLSQQVQVPHVVVCPSAGIGHVLPFHRLAFMLSESGCRVTLMTVLPSLSKAETNQISTLLATHPHIHPLYVQIPCNNNNNNSNTREDASKTTNPTDGPDPFFLRYTAISDSAHLLAQHIISLTPRPTAILADIMFLYGFFKAQIDIPIYILPITSARFFILTAYLPRLASSTNINSDEDKEKEIVLASGIAPIPTSWIPPPFFNPNHIFTKLITKNSSYLHKCKGIVYNSFDYLEHDSLCVLEDKQHNLPPVFPIGPLKVLNDDSKTSRVLLDRLDDVDDDDASYFRWLDEQASESVMYVNFGSRTAMSKEQIRELRDGLDMSGVKFLWVVKTTEVDKEDKVELSELLGETFLEKLNKGGKGLVLKRWVKQDRVLVHLSVGGFLTHCGWNSTVEAAQIGLPVLAWPLHGDQKLNAQVLEKAGLGVWPQDWGWIGSRLVKSDEIAEKIKEVMMNEGLRKSARKVGEEATKAWDVNGSSRVAMGKLIVEMSA